MTFMDSIINLCACDLMLNGVFNLSMASIAQNYS